MQVDRQRKILPERTDELPCGGRPEQTRHIFYAKYVYSRPNQLLRFTQVIIKRVQVLRRAGEVPGVADRPLGNFAGFQDRSDGRDHLVDVVESIEYPEYIDPRTGRFSYKGDRHLVGIG